MHLVPAVSLFSSCRFSPHRTHLKESLNLVFREVNLQILHRCGHLGHVDAPAAVGVPFVEHSSDVAHNCVTREVSAIRGEGEGGNGKHTQRTCGDDKHDKIFPPCALTQGST